MNGGDSRQEVVQYHVQRGSFWIIIWPKLKFVIIMFFVIIALYGLYSYFGWPFLLGFLTIPFWVPAIQRFLRKEATPVLLVDIKNNLVEVHLVQDLSQWKVKKPLWVGKVLLAEEMDHESRTISGPPIAELSNINFFLHRELFLKLKENYPKLLKRLALYQYGADTMALEKAIQMLGQFATIEDMPDLTPSRIIPRPQHVKKIVEEVKDGENG